MPEINWARLIIGGSIATVICFLSDGLLHEKWLGQTGKRFMRTCEPSPLLGK